MKRKVKLGLYGCGNRTRALLDCVAGEDECQVVVAYDLRPEAVKTLCEKYGGKACLDEKELIASREVDAFIISLDPFAHPEAFDKTIKAGKPIFIEKPISPTAERAYKMMKKAQAAKVPVHVGFIHRYGPAMPGIQKLLKDKNTGRILSIHYVWYAACETEIINCTNNRPDNFRLRISQIPYHCCHALDVIRLLMGEVKSVYAYAIKWQKWNYVTPDEVIALFEFKNDAIGTFHFCGLSYGVRRVTQRIHTENCTIEFNPGGDYSVWYRPKYKAERDDRSADCRPNWLKHVGPDTHEFARDTTNPQVMLDFLNAVRDGTPMTAPIEDGYKVAEIAGAIELSYARRKKIELPLRF